MKNHGNQPKTMKNHETTLKNHANQFFMFLVGFSWVEVTSSTWGPNWPTWLKNVTSPTQGPNWPTWLKNVTSPTQAPNWPPWLKNVTSPTRGPNWPFRCLDLPEGQEDAVSLVIGQLVSWPLTVKIWREGNQAFSSYYTFETVSQSVDITGQEEVTLPIGGWYGDI